MKNAPLILRMFQKRLTLIESKKVNGKIHNCKRKNHFNDVIVYWNSTFSANDSNISNHLKKCVLIAFIYMKPHDCIFFL
jgi:hypothetical protein